MDFLFELKSEKSWFKLFKAYDVFVPRLDLKALSSSFPRQVQAIKMVSWKEIVKLKALKVSLFLFCNEREKQIWSASWKLLLQSIPRFYSALKSVEIKKLWKLLKSFLSNCLESYLNINHKSDGAKNIQSSFAWSASGESKNKSFKALC